MVGQAQLVTKGEKAWPTSCQRQCHPRVSTLSWLWRCHLTLSKGPCSTESLHQHSKSFRTYIFIYLSNTMLTMCYLAVFSSLPILNHSKLIVTKGAGQCFYVRFIFILYLRKLRQNVKELFQGHIARKWHSLPLCCISPSDWYVRSGTYAGRGNFWPSCSL